MGHCEIPPTPSIHGVPLCIIPCQWIVRPSCMRLFFKFTTILKRHEDQICVRSFNRIAYWVDKMKNKKYHTVGTVPKSIKWKRKKYHTVGTVPKSIKWKTKKYHCWNSSKIHRMKNRKHHNVGTVPKAIKWKTKNTTLLEQFQNAIEKS